MKARWCRLYPVQLPDGTVVGLGDEALISKGEAQQSDNWEPIGKPKATGKDAD